MAVLTGVVSSLALVLVPVALTLPLGGEGAVGGEVGLENGVAFGGLMPMLWLLPPLMWLFRRCLCRPSFSISPREEARERETCRDDRI